MRRHVSERRIVYERGIGCLDEVDQRRGDVDDEVLHRHPCEMVAVEDTLNEPPWYTISSQKLRQARLAARLCLKLWA